VQFFFSSDGAQSAICKLRAAATSSRFATEADMTMTHREDIQRRIIELEVEHRDLDAVIDLLSREVRHEELQLRRLKKRKLQLKDHIMLLRMQLIPDIPA
jgi:hypothetical protein